MADRVARGTFTGTWATSEGITTGFAPSLVFFWPFGVYRLDPGLYEERTAWIGVDLATSTPFFMQSGEAWSGATVSFTATGFDLGGELSYHANNMAWLALSSSAGVRTGSYIGDGSDDRHIEAGVQPDFVHVGCTDSGGVIEESWTTSAAYATSSEVVSVAPTGGGSPYVAGKDYTFSLSAGITTLTAEQYWPGAEAPYLWPPRTAGQGPGCHILVHRHPDQVRGVGGSPVYLEGRDWYTYYLPSDTARPVLARVTRYTGLNASILTDDLTAEIVYARGALGTLGLTPVVTSLDGLTTYGLGADYIATGNLDVDSLGHIVSRTDYTALSWINLGSDPGLIKVTTALPATVVVNTRITAPVYRTVSLIAPATASRFYGPQPGT